MSKFGQNYSENILTIDDDDSEDGILTTKDGHKEDTDFGILVSDANLDNVLRILSHQIDLEILYKHQEKMLLLKCIKYSENLLDVLSRLAYLGISDWFIIFVECFNTDSGELQRLSARETDGFHSSPSYSRKRRSDRTIQYEILSDGSFVKFGFDQCVTLGLYAPFAKKSCLQISLG